MVLVQHLLGVLEVQVVVGQFAPRKVQHELDVIVLDAVIRRRGIVLLQPGHLLVEDGADLLGPLLFVSAGAELGEILALIHSELLLDGLQLVVQVILPLLLVDVALDLLVDFLLDLQELDLGIQDLQQFHPAVLQVGQAEQAEAVGEILDLDGRRDEIHQELEVVDGLEGAHRLLRSEGRGPDDVRGPLLERVGQDVDLLVVRSRKLVFQIVDAGDHVRLESEEGIQVHPLESLDDRRQGAVGHLQGLDDLAHGSEFEHIPGPGFLDGDVGLGNGGEHTVLLLHLPDQEDGFFPADGHGEHRAREDDGVAQGKHRQVVGELGLVQFQQGRITDHRHDIHFYARMGGHLLEIFHLHSKLGI